MTDNNDKDFDLFYMAVNGLLPPYMADEIIENADADEIWPD